MKSTKKKAAVVSAVEASPNNGQGTSKLTREQLLRAADEYRAKYADGRLSPRLIARLEDIPGWSWDDEPGHPDPKADPEAWMADIRSRYAAGTLPKWKIERVEQIPGWKW